MQQRANEIAKETGKEKDPVKKQAMIAEGKKLREQALEDPASPPYEPPELREILDLPDSLRK